MTGENRRIRVVRFLFSDAHGDSRQRILVFAWNDRDELLPFTERGYLFDRLRQMEPSMTCIRKSRECVRLNAIATDHFRSFHPATGNEELELFQMIERLISASIGSIDSPQTDWRNQ